ncbi:MAG: amidohydrolase [Proteobacteria bacterium]|nr:MAG: amidohydrolase [Pseudomonadota bacterium]
MKILKADFILTCNERFDILQDKAICFDKNIIEIGEEKILRSKYPAAKFEKSPKNTILMAGLINPHTHLEFSANRSILTYGSFIPWLNSVIKNRDEIMELSTKESIEKALNEMLESGTTTIGAISSAGLDLEVCKKSKARVVYFNEILGSNPASADVLFEDFKSRLLVSLQEKNDRLIPAISVHSPYSTHPILAKKALEIAQKNDFLVSTHFMESLAEREWLNKGSGEFVNFFAPFNPHAKPFLSGSEYLKLFKNNKTLFTHCVHTNKKELNIIKNQNATITHCPASNRLLGTGLMDYKATKDINLTLGTDGYSSNRSLNMWDELRVALFSHTNEALRILAKDLLKSATINGAKALHLDAGSLEVGKKADLILIELKQIPKSIDQLPLQLILHTKKVKKVFIEGEYL